MITTFYPPYNFGGDGIFVHRLSNALAERGHHVEVIHCIDSYCVLGGREPTEGYNDHPNVTAHGIRSRWGLLSPLATQQTGYPFFKSDLIQRVLQSGFDVIHYHNISLIGGPKVLEYGRGIKLYTMHEYWLVCATHGLFRFDRAICVQPHCFLCSLTYRRPPQWWRFGKLLKNAVKHVDAFIAPSGFIKDKHRELDLDIPMVHIPHFVPVEGGTGTTEDSWNNERFPETPYFLFVGRLETVKGPQTLIPVFQSYQKARLLIAGEGSCETALKRSARGCKNIQFLGYQSERRLRTLYERATALIVPSVCIEVFSLSIIEAFRQKTPVIVRNLGGMPELVQASGGGFTYDGEKELLAALDRLMANPDLRGELGIRGYRCYHRLWTTQAHLERYLGLIREISKMKRGEDLETEFLHAQSKT
jgi:glycosyltransferase involved in cell wall biosynthesis